MTRRAPLQVSRITGDVAPAGDAIHLRIEADAHASDILLLPTDVGGLVNMLLALVSAASEPRTELVDGQRPAVLPLPAAALSVGEATDGQALLGIEVGCAQFVFSIPRSALTDLAHALLAASADGPLAT